METDKQLTADDILHEVYLKRQNKAQLTKSKVHVDILDLEELKDLQRRKRSEYESYLKRNRLDMGQWLRYATFEIKQNDIRRARSIFERALLVDRSYIPLWIRYIDTEIKQKFINHARNVLNRAVNTLPRVDKLWYKYLILEENLGNINIVRALFNKWILLEPNTNAWDSFIDFEIRQKKLDEARTIYSKYVMVHPRNETWQKWFNFEKKYGSVDTVRKTFVLALDTMQSYLEHTTIKFEATVNELLNDVISIIISFSDWEASQGEYERCRALYNLAIEQWPNQKVLKDNLVNFEKNFGKDINNIENNIVQKRKRSYEEALQRTPNDYDTWWMYLDLIEKYDITKFSKTFDTCLENSKPVTLKKDAELNRYICIWIRYLIYVETKQNNIEDCRSLYSKLLFSIIPNRQFTYPEIWIMFSKFEIRQGNISNARGILGKALGICPSNEIFRSYINMELKLKEFDRVRTLYEKYIYYQPTSEELWLEYASLEYNLGDEERARGLYNIALSPDLNGFDKKSKVRIIKALIEFETDTENFDKARKSYELYLDISDNDKLVWIEFAMYVLSTPTEKQFALLNDKIGSDEDVEFTVTADNIMSARRIFERGIAFMKAHERIDDRVYLYNAYMNFEEAHGDDNLRRKLLLRMPKLVKIKYHDKGIEKERMEYTFYNESETETEGSPVKPNLSKMKELAEKWQQSQIDK